MSKEKCFCHLNGYKVKDADARAELEAQKTVIAGLSEGITDHEERVSALESESEKNRLYQHWIEGTVYDSNLYSNRKIKISFISKRSTRFANGEEFINYLAVGEYGQPGAYNREFIVNGCATDGSSDDINFSATRILGDNDYGGFYIDGYSSIVLNIAQIWVTRFITFNSTCVEVE